MRLPYFEGLRGFMAIWVVFIHSIAFTPFYFENFLTNGKLPVVGFILLSGFVTYILLTKNEKYSIYLKRRALRLFPIYLVAFVISLLMLKFNLDNLSNLFFTNNVNNIRINLINQALENNLILNIISHITLTHGLFPNDKFPFSFTIMGQSWSLTLEWQFYIIIPLLFKIIQKPIKKVRILVFFSIYIISYYLSYRLMNQMTFLPIMFHFFLIGFFSFPLYKKFADSGSTKLFIFLFISIILLSKINYQYSIILVIWGIVLWMQKNGNKIGEFLLNNKLSLFIGKISYSIYCVHMIILFFLVHINKSISLGAPKTFTMIILIGGILISVIVSIFTYKYIEEPFIRWGKKTNNKLN